MESYIDNTIHQLENFKYIEEAVEIYSAAVKNLRLLGDFNLCLQRIETCHYSHKFLLALQSCYLIPTIDKPTRVYRTSASLTDNILLIIPGSGCCKWQPYYRC